MGADLAPPIKVLVLNIAVVTRKVDKARLLTAWTLAAAGKDSLLCHYFLVPCIQKNSKYPKPKMIYYFDSWIDVLDLMMTICIICGHWL